MTDTISLTVKSTIKKIDEMTLACPSRWTIYQLKIFVALNHLQGQEYLKAEKTQYYFGGRLIENNKTLKEVFKGKDLHQNFTLIAKFIASSEAEAAKEADNFDEEREKILEDYNNLLSGYDDERQNTNIGSYEAYVKLPVLSSGLSKHLSKIHKGTEAPTEDIQRAAENDQDFVEFPYILKLIFRVLVFFFLFKSHLHGVFLYVFIGMLVIYFLIKLSQNKAKERNQQRQQQQQGGQRGNAVEQPNVNQAGNEQAQDDAQAQPTVIKSNFFNKAKELLICFVSSLYPSWDLNLYIENNPVAQPQAAIENPSQDNANAANNEIVDESNNNATEINQENKINEINIENKLEQINEGIDKTSHSEERVPLIENTERDRNDESNIAEVKQNLEQEDEVI